MRRFTILAVALLAIGCSSHSSIPAPSHAAPRTAPQVFQKNPNNHGWQLTNLPRGAQAIAIAPDYATHKMYASSFLTGSRGIITQIRMDRTTRVHPISIVPSHIIVGPDGNVWGTGGGTIVRVAIPGAETDYTPDSDKTMRFGQVTNGPDGAIWFAACDQLSGAGGVGRIDMAGNYNLYPTSCSWVVAAAPDENIWSVDHTGLIHVMDTQGNVIASYTLDGVEKGTKNSNMIAGPDGLLYVMAPNVQNFTTMFSISMSGVVSDLGDGGEITAGISNGPGGNIWALTEGGDEGWLTFYNIASQRWNSVVLRAPGFGPISDGPDGNVWMAVHSKQRLVATYDWYAMTVAPSTLGVPVGQGSSLSVTENNYVGSWTAVCANKKICSAAPGQANGTFVVSGLAPGSTVVTIYDSQYNSVQAAVTVQ